MIYIDLTDYDNLIAVQKPDLFYHYFHWGLDVKFQKGLYLNDYDEIHAIAPTSLAFWTEEADGYEDLYES